MSRKSNDRPAQNKPRTTGGRRDHGLESLESRQMLSSTLLGPVIVPPNSVAPQAAAAAPSAASGTIDLTVQISATAALPANATSGATTKIKLPFLIGNAGPGTVASGTTIVVKIFARLVGAADSSHDILIDTINNVNVGNLTASGKSLDPSFTLPASLASGNYNLVVVVNDGANPLPESNTANDSAVTSGANGAVNVTQGTLAVSATSATPFVGATLIPGENFAGKGWVTVVFSNTGTIRVPRGEKITISIYLRPTNATDSSGDILISSRKYGIGGLKAGSAKTIAIRLGEIPGDLAAGVYKFVAVVDSAMVLPNTSSTTNTTVSSSTVTAKAHHQSTSGDLVITTATTNLTSISLSGATGTATIGFSNIGNALASGTYTINLYATTNGTIPTGATPIGTSGPKTLNVAAGAAGASTSFSFILPTTMTLTAYQLVAQISATSTGTITADGNTADDTKPAGTISVTPTLPLLGFIGTTVTLTQTVAPVTAAGQASSSGTFTDNNNKSGTYTYVANTNGSTNHGILTLTFTGSNADVVTLQLTTASATAPTSLNGSTLTFQIGSTGAAGTFSATVKSEGVTVTGSYDLTGVDLVITSATNNLPSIALGGATGTATVNFTNQGTKTASGTYTVNIYATTNGIIAAGATPIGTSGPQSLTLAGGAASGPIVVNITMPSPGGSTLYILVAQVVTSDTTVNPAGNTLTSGPSVTVAPTLPLLGNIGTTVKLTETSAPVTANGQATSSGTFTDSNNQSGTYTFVVSTTGSTNQGVLTLTLTGSLAGDTVTLTLTSNAASQATSLAGDTLVFEADSTGTSGSFSGTVHSEAANTAGFYILNPVELAVTTATTNLHNINLNGATGTATVNFTNTGTQTASGNFTINIYASPSGVIDSNAVLVGTSGQLPLGLAPSASEGATIVNITMPSPSVSTTYTLIAQVVASPVAGDPTINTKTISSAQVGPTLPLLGNFGTALTFTNTSSPVVSAGQISYAGTYTSTNGRSGTFTYVINTSGAVSASTLTLTLANTPADTVTLALVAASGSAPTTLASKTLTFSASTTGSNGSFSGTTSSEGVASTGFYTLS